MRKILAITQLTVDGVMQAPGGPDEDTSNDFTHGGWAMRFGDEVGKQNINDIISGEFDMLLGRRTYDIFSSYWPLHGDNPIGKAFNKATKYIASNTLTQLSWEHAHIIGGDVIDEISKLKTTEGPDIHIWGSSNLLQTLIAANLIDEYQLWVFPIVLGPGKAPVRKWHPTNWPHPY